MELPGKTKHSWQKCIDNKRIGKQRGKRLQVYPHSKLKLLLFLFHYCKSTHKKKKEKNCSSSARLQETAEQKVWVKLYSLSLRVNGQDDKTSDLTDLETHNASPPGQSSQTWRAWSFLVIRTTFWTKGRAGVGFDFQQVSPKCRIWTQQSSGLLFEMVQLMFNSHSFHTWGISTFQTRRFNSIIFVHLSLY